MKTVDDVLAFAATLGDVQALWPYGPGVRVLFWMPKYRAFCNIMERDGAPLHLVMKCDPIEAEMLRMACPAVRPGYHMNKRHWNSVYLDGTLPDAEIRRMLQNAYLLVSGRGREVTPLRAP